MVEVEMIPLSKLKLLFIREVSQEGLEELAQSIKFTGILEPLVIRAKDYGVICGFRRYKAAQKAGLSEVPCVLVDCDDAEAFRLSLVENLQRENLSDYEMAKRLSEYKQKTGFGEAKIAALLGKSQTWVSRHLQMLKLDMPQGIGEKLSEKHVRTILSQPEEIQKQLMEDVARVIVERGEPPSVREIERKAKELLKPPEEEVEGGTIEEILEAAEKAMSEPDADKIQKFQSSEELEQWLDSLLSPPKAEETEHLCPCGCGWGVSINWRKRDITWVIP